MFKFFDTLLSFLDIVGHRNYDKIKQDYSIDEFKDLADEAVVGKF